PPDGAWWTPTGRVRRPTWWFPTPHGWPRWTSTGRWPPTTTVGRPRPQRPRWRTPPAVLSRPPAAPPATEEEERLRLWVRGVRRDRPCRARFDLPPGLGCLRLGLRDLRRRRRSAGRLGLPPNGNPEHETARAIWIAPRLRQRD